MSPRDATARKEPVPTEPDDRQRWTAVDRYLAGLFGPDDPAFDQGLREAEAAGLPSIQVSQEQGRLLHLLATVQGARAILEIGTLGGFSTTWLARALPPGGRLVSLEIDPRHAEVARRNLARAGFAGRVEVRVGPALDSLAALEREHRGPFDLFFVDADKEGYAEYLDWALRLSRPGSLLIADNVIRNGAVADPDDPEPRVRGIRRFFDRLAHEPRWEAAAVQMVGAKGYDGWAIARVRTPEKPR